nr:B-box zinc finger protein 32-like [Ipomoea trifida]
MGGGGGYCCELCKGEAAVCCPSDSAFLCWSCDAKVHQANFLVARHLRFIVCSECKSVTGNRVSGVREAPFSDLAHSSCSRKSARSSECSDSAGDFEKKSQKRPPRGARSEAVDPVAEGIFVNWCARLGIGGGEDKHVTRKARGAFRLCLAHMTALPYRVSLAASLWFGLRRCPGKPGHTWRALRRLEQISGVPAKLIASAESKLQLAEKAGKQRRQWLTEGWDECSV